jgi:hypothetical protein
MRGMAANAPESLSGSRARDARSTYSNPVSLPTQGADNARETAEICHDLFMAKLSAWVTAGLVLTTLQLACTTDWAKTQYDEYRQRAHGLDTQTVTAGLKQALELGTQRSVAILSQVNGYLKNPEARIPLPDELHKTAAFLRKIGADRYADECAPRRREGGFMR